MKMLPPNEKFATSTYNDHMPYKAYFHSLLKSSGASRLELVRDDAMILGSADPLEDARFLLNHCAPPKVDSGLPSLPNRKPSVDNLLQLLSQSAPNEMRIAHGDTCCCEYPHHECSSFSPRTQRREQTNQGTRKSWPGCSERPSIREVATPEECDIPPTAPTRRREMPARNFNKRKHCRWSASSVPATKVGS
ncbi:unnamed protein product [Cylindrotheca closterium]|uniref:Uncharacterized protein n=1 Tax=Cylindrotheca closterium TaxID=2856 RepID=A0AAD2G2V4_9STRA|nr:unnamed protein product [Cylindrotheca closterium]